MLYKTAGNTGTISGIVFKHRNKAGAGYLTGETQQDGKTVSSPLPVSITPIQHM
jgi:hypothetical protein